MPVNMRMSASDERFFSPDRDLAYCSPHLVHRAMLGLDPEKQEPWIRAYLEENNIKLDDLVDAARVIAHYMNTSLLDPQYKEPLDALTASGFFKLDPKVQNIVCAKLGQVFLASIFPAIRDVTRDPSDPPFKAEQFGEVIKHFQKRLLESQNTPDWLKKLYGWWRYLLSFIGL